MDKGGFEMDGGRDNENAFFQCKKHQKKAFILRGYKVDI
jgi:hypothetical protein